MTPAEIKQLPTGALLRSLGSDGQGTYLVIVVPVVDDSIRIRVQGGWVEEQVAMRDALDLFWFFKRVA
jgi:hypothetical protein